MKYYNIDFEGGKSMKAKIFVILVVMLLIATSLPVIGIANIKKMNENPLQLSNGAIDQEQTSHCGYGMHLFYPYMMGQSFKPSVEDLTAVQLWMFYYGWYDPDDFNITVSIRDTLNGTDLTSKTINSNDVYYYGGGEQWIYFNFDNIAVIPEETYYIICSANKGNFTHTFCWLFDENDKYTRGEGWFSQNYGVWWRTLWDHFNYSHLEWDKPDFCFKTYTKDSAICCDGSLSWKDIPPGSTVSDTFKISNCGDNGSLLNWEVGSHPKWDDAEIYINPWRGYDLQEGDSITITINVTAPTKKNGEYNGTIKMINSDDPTNFCEIPVSLTTPRTRASSYHWYEWLFERFPLLERLLGLIK